MKFSNDISVKKSHLFSLKLDMDEVKRNIARIRIFILFETNELVFLVFKKLGFCFFWVNVGIGTNRLFLSTIKIAIYLR